MPNANLAQASAVYGLLAIRALAEHDPVEYGRACDASRASLDRRIEIGIAALSEDLRTEAQDQYRRLRAPDPDGNGRTNRTGETWQEEQLRFKSIESLCRMRSIQFAFQSQRTPEAP
jgi:hypothetical protein